VRRKLSSSRSQAESYIKLGHVFVNGEKSQKPGKLVSLSDRIEISAVNQYVSRAGHKLASVADKFELNFKDKAVLDVGSSTGGFTDYALRHGAKKVIAVELGTDQLHPSLRGSLRIELHEQTDIRTVQALSTKIDVVVIDVSFVSLREVLPHVARLIRVETVIIAMVKPQFETGEAGLKHKGVIKNDAMRRTIFKEFEQWASRSFRIVAKADSAVHGEKGNQERFYKLFLLK